MKPSGHVAVQHKETRNVIDIPGYRLLRQLGRGGMATVYLAVQESVDREVALKIMSPALLVDPNFGERFLREAKIAARLNHRNVVGIHDVGRAGDYHYIAMEYCSGGPVLPQDGSAARTVGFALRVTREIAGALNYAQEKGFVHRDVKPDNILLRDDGSAALTDFGIARALDPALRMTKTGTVVGTPHYMSPEQARGKQVDGRSDLYGLGIVLHEMLVGYVPFHAEDSLAIGIMHITQPVPILPDGLVALQPLMQGLLAKQPEERFQTGNEVAAAIVEIEDRIRAGVLPELAGVPVKFRREATPLDTLMAPSPVPSSQSFGGMRDRAEPNLGRIDQIVAALGNDVMRAERESSTRVRARSRHDSKRAPTLLVLLAVLAIGAFAAWHYQDQLRRWLPRTEFNDTLSRAQQALAAGRLTGTQGDSARELFLAARAQNPDNDIARRGIETVGQQLLQRAQDALGRGDLAAARTALDAARELLGGGLEADRLDQTLKQREAQGTATAQLLEQATKALAAGQLVGDDGAAALYQRVLASDKANALAQSGLTKVVDALATQTRSALAANNADSATALTDDIARILPAYPALPELFGRIAQARDSARTATEGTLDRAEAALRADNLNGGEGSALDLFNAVLRQDPANARAKAGLGQVAQALVAQANAAIDDNHPGSAETLLNAAAKIAPASPALRAAQSNLRDLREHLADGARQAVVTPAQAAQVRQLVRQAEAAAARGDLIVPPGDSAYDKYRAALALDGNDSSALAGIARLPARARELFARALTNGAPERARALLDTVRQIAPDDVALAAMADKLANAFLDQADSFIGEGHRVRAARALNAARQLSPNNARLAPLDGRLRAMSENRG